MQGELLKPRQGSSGSEEDNGGKNEVLYSCRDGGLLHLRTESWISSKVPFWRFGQFGRESTSILGGSHILKKAGE
jgi:hypothetical protein